MSSDESITLFDFFYSNIEWQASEIKLFGKIHSTPRLEAFYCSINKVYTYSGKQLKTVEFTPEIIKLLGKVELLVPNQFNAVLFNLYRDGMDSNGWHADNEKSLGKNPLIASLSLGETRKFDLKHIPSNSKMSFKLNAGSLFIMGGEMQHYWKHQLPKSPKVLSPRINLTFRKMI